MDTPNLTKVPKREHWGVVCYGRDAQRLIQRVLDKYRINAQHISRYQYLFGQENILSWVPITESSRGHRIHKLFCTHGISMEFYHNVLLYMYLGREEDIIWL